jgi:hypothetical protein
MTRDMEKIVRREDHPGQSLWRGVWAGTFVLLVAGAYLSVLLWVVARPALFHVAGAAALPQAYSTTL